MIRLTFITGAGKLGRQRYDPDAAKAVTSTLRELGYEEDRGASCVVECAGSFKLQHDTGKNLKTVVVFPKLVTVGTTTTTTKTTYNNLVESTNHQGEHEKHLTLLLQEGSPEHLIATSSMTVFQRMLSSKCPSWSQKKGCATALESLRLQMSELDGKLVTGTPLDAAEQHFYDTVSYLEDKEEHVRIEMHHQVERGDISAWEQETLISHNAERIAALQKDKTMTKKALLDKAMQRKKLLSDMVPKEPHNLRHEVTIRKLRKELLPFLYKEEEQKGRLRSVKETQMMARKDEIEHEIAALEEDSRGWFEDEDAFQSRVAASRASFAATHSKPKVKKAAAVAATGGGTATKTMGPNQKWVLPGDVKKGYAAAAAGGPNKKKNKSKAGNVFSAMIIDDDDDEDEDDDDNDGNIMVKRETNKQHAATSRSAAVDIAVVDAVEAKQAGSPRKKKKGKKNDHEQSEDRALDQAFAQERKAKQKQEEEDAKHKQVSHPAIAIVRDHILPILAAMITWFIALLIGKPKKRKEKGR